MSREQLENLGWYALFALGGAVIATGVQLGIVLSGDAPVLIRPLAATFVTTLFGTLATAVGTATLTRYGSEPLARQVNDLREQGYHRRDLTVVPKADAEPDLGAIVDVPKVFPEAPAHLVFHDSPEGHIAFLTTAVPTPGAEMAEGEAFHVADHRPFAPDADKRYRCDSCDRVLDHVAAVAGEWVATGLEGAP